MTNGDRIRQMTDEEILEFFFGPTEAYTISRVVPVVENINGMTMQHLVSQRYIDWLKEEYKENG